MTANTKISSKPETPDIPGICELLISTAEQVEADEAVHQSPVISHLHCGVMSDMETGLALYLEKRGFEPYTSGDGWVTYVLVIGCVQITLSIITPPENR